MKKIIIMCLGLLFCLNSILPTALEEDTYQIGYLSDGFESEDDGQEPAIVDPDAELFRVINLEADLFDGVSNIDQAIENLVNYAGADVEAEDNKGNRPLHVAAAAGLVHVVGVLLEFGADVNAKNGDEQTALRVAIREGHLGTAQVLLDQGAYVSKAALRSCRINFGPKHPFVAALKAARMAQCID